MISVKDEDERDIVRLKGGAASVNAIRANVPGRQEEPVKKGKKEKYRATLKFYIMEDGTIQVERYAFEHKKISGRTIQEILPSLVDMLNDLVFICNYEPAPVTDRERCAVVREANVEIYAARAAAKMPIFA